jgi:signal transduction histidine kinase
MSKRSLASQLMMDLPIAQHLEILEHKYLLVLAAVTFPFPVFLLQLQRFVLMGFLLCLAGCTPSATSSPEKLFDSAQWWMDASGQATLDDVQQVSNWQALPEWKSWGFGTESVWTRMQVKAARPDERTPWVVRVRPPFLDYVTLYDPTTGIVIRSGDAVAPDSDGLASINFTLQIPTHTHERTIYLELKSTSARILNVEVLPYGMAQRQNRIQEWLLGLVAASSIIFTIWASIQWWNTREKVICAFAIKQFFAVGWAFFILGFARVAVGPWLPEGVLSTLSSLVLVGVISVTLWFFSVLIEGYRPLPAVLFVIRYLVIAVACLPLLHWLGRTHLMLALANASILLSVTLLTLALLTATPGHSKQPIPLGVLLAYVMAYGVLNAIPPAISLELLEAHSVMLYTNLAHAVLDGVVMFVILQIRARTLRKEQIQAGLDLQRSQQQAETEKHHRQEQSQLFAMLAHEMKTPLATLRMWMEAGPLKPEVMERAISDMNQVIERCVQTGQLAEQGLKPMAQDLDPEALTRISLQSCREPERVDFASRASRGSLRADSQMLAIVLGNLLDNACKYGAPNGRIRVMLEPQTIQGRRGWHWSIRNEPGVAGLPDPAQLFRKYYRGTQARRLSGSGLGLFLVKSMLDLMKGHITYAEVSGEVNFSIWLPEQEY